jgi:hypothetical protein
VREGRERMVLKGPCGDRAEKILRKKIDENFGLFTLLDRGRAQKARNSNWCALELLFGRAQDGQLLVLACNMTRQ